MSGEVVVKPVFSWWDRRRFVDLPRTLYRDDPYWIPPLRGNQRELLGYRPHPFHESAEMQTFLAWRGGQVCGRIAGIVNHAHNRFHSERRGFFGFFESVNDQPVASALFDAVRQWLRERDIHALRGPTNPSMNYECGLLIDGFDSPPTFMMTYNPPYYMDLVEAYGFVKGHDLLAYYGHRDQLPALITRIGSLAEQARARCDCHIRPLNPKHFMADVELFIDLYNRSLVVNWGFVPLAPREMEKMATSLKHLVVPELSMLAEVDGRAVGAVLGLPDYNPQIKQINGRLYPFGFLKLLRNRRRSRRLRILSINVVPEYQRWGLGLVLMLSLVPKVLELDVQEAEFSWISEDNDLARMGLEKGGARPYKTYRIYDLQPQGDPNVV